jgi:uncharacterized protein (TIGR02284 family)
MRNEEMIGYLNDLIETCKDGELGFRNAAQSVGEEGDAELRTLLNAFAQQRARFAAELQNEVLRRGGEPAKDSHVSARFHRGWMNLKAAVAGMTEASVIAECDAGEQAAMRNYENVLKETVPADLLAIVEKQYMEIRQAHSRIRSLERAYKSG